MQAGSYSMREIQAITGLQARTIRTWIRIRLLPKPLGRGRGARYTDEHLLRIRAVLELRRKRKSLAAIRFELEDLSADALQAMLPPPPLPVGAHGVPLPPPEPTYSATLWEFIQLAEGMVLLVDTTKGPLPRRIADAICKHYGNAQTRRA